jgi:hypothetical protein
MAKPAIPPTVSVDRVRGLLERYRCPVPFHAVRTRLLGSIASPNPQASPIKVVEALWGGTLPPFDTLDAANELIGALVMGLWNRLTRHQERSAPFRLSRIDVPATREGLGRLALMRQEELEGFVEGLFGDKESLDLPEQAHKALGVLADIRAMVEATVEVAQNRSKPGGPAEVATTLGLFREVTRIAEQEIHGVVLSCTRARRQMERTSPTSRPVLH